MPPQAIVAMAAASLIAVAACAPASPPAPTMTTLPVPTAVTTPTQAPPPTRAPSPTPAERPSAVAAASVVAVKPTLSPAPEARIEQAVLAKGQRNLEPVDPTTTFRPNAKEIVVAGRVVGAPRGTKLKATWLATDVQGGQAPERLLERELDVDGTRPFAFTIEPRQPLPAGGYAVELSVNGKVAQRLAFAVVAPPIHVLARPEVDLPDLPGAAPAAEPKPTTLQFIVDASGSMAETLRGVPKMDVAKEALHTLVSGLPNTSDTLNVGFRAYAHRYPTSDRAKSCEDSELLVPMQGIDKTKLHAQIDALKPTGWTPMAFAVQQAARDFKVGDTENVVVMVTDGEETCSQDPVGAIKAAAQPAKVTVHVVGFDIGEPRTRQQLQAIADATGGVYVDARSADELAAALRKIAAEQVKVLRVRSGAGQLRFEPPEGTTLSSWIVKDSDGKAAISERVPMGQHKKIYTLAPGLYTVEFKPTSSGEGALFRVEIGAGQESVLRLGGLKLLARQDPHRWQVLDLESERQVSTPGGNEIPKVAMLLPPGRYSVLVQTTASSQFTTLAKEVEVKLNTIAEVQF